MKVTIINQTGAHVEVHDRGVVDGQRQLDVIVHKSVERLVESGRGAPLAGNDEPPISVSTPCEKPRPYESIFRQYAEDQARLAALIERETKRDLADCCNLPEIYDEPTYPRFACRLTIDVTHNGFVVNAYPPGLGDVRGVPLESWSERDEEELGARIVRWLRGAPAGRKPKNPR